MKSDLILLCILFSLSLSAQTNDVTKDSLRHNESATIILRHQKTTPQDTSIYQKENQDKKELTASELFMLGKKASPNRYYSSFKGHWSGFQYGFVNFTHIPSPWEDLELDWCRSFAMQFNLFKYDINLSCRDNLGLLTGLGLEYQRLQFNKDDISIMKQDGDLIMYHPTEHDNNIGSVRRSCFKTLYLTIPLLMEVQFPARNKKRMYVSAGFMGGIRMHSKTKIVYKDEEGEKHKKKEKGNFNMIPFKADAIARIGYHHVNVWGNYTLTNMFKSGDTPKLHAYTVGLGLSF